MKIYKNVQSYFGNPLILCLFIFLSQTSISQNLAFPTAYGAGAYTFGGRGGTVSHVTTLADSGPGSLRSFANVSNTTIIFDVSGVIRLKDQLYFTGHNVTIAGQTAPEGGITIDNHRVVFDRNSQVICRFIRFRGGYYGPRDNDTFSGYGLNDVIFDHCSFSFALDEAFSIVVDRAGQTGGNVTVQNCLLAESAKGSIMGSWEPSAPDSFKSVTMAYNVFYNITHRHPNLVGSGRSDIINNYIHNAKFRLINARNGSKLNQLNNVYDFGPQPGAAYIYNKTLNLFTYIKGESLTKIYSHGNILKGEVHPHPNHITSNTIPAMNSNNRLMWKYFYDNTEVSGFGKKMRGDQLESEFFVDNQYPLLGLAPPIISTDKLKQEIVMKSGASKRLNEDGSVSNNDDDFDASWKTNIMTNKYIDRIPDNQYAKIEINILSKRRPSKFYQSNPHIPEIWFKANVPMGQDHNDIAPSGYTWLEEYLNGVDRTNEVIGVGSVEVSPKTWELKNEDTLQLTATFTPTNATNKNGTWNSSDEEIATVDSNGLVTAVSEGEVAITFKSNDGGIKTTSLITVFPEAFQGSAGNDQQICKGTTTTLTASGGTNYVWSTGETTETIEVTPKETTTYTVTVSDDDGQSDEASVTVSVNEMPTASAGEDQTICNGETIMLTATAPEGASYLWSTGEKTASIEVKPAVDAVYSVEVSNDTCSSTDEVSVFVKETPELKITGDLIISEGESTTLTVSGGNNYKWNTGETNETITVSPKVTTTYFVSSNNPDGCSSYGEITVKVAQQVVANAGQDVDICLGTTVTLTATGGASYLWSTGVKTKSIEVNPKETTKYSVTAFDGTGTNSDTDEVTVTVNPLPIVDAGNNRTIDSGESVTLTGTGATSYKWSTGETSASITVSPTATKTYTVTGTTNGCEVKDTVTVTVLNSVEVIADAGVDQSICSGADATLTATGGSTYLWNTGATTASINVKPTATTTYSVTAYDNTGKFSDKDEVTVTVNALPLVDAGKNITINSGQSTKLTATGANSYEWSTGATSASITVSPKVTKTYTVTGMRNGCKVTAKVKVTVVEPEVVVARAGGNQDVCEGGEVTLTATGGERYLWSTGAKTASIKVNPKVTTKYSVTAYVGNASGTDEVIVKVSPKPNVSIINGSEATILEGEFITLSAKGADKYKWSNGATQPNIAVRPTKTKTYDVVGYVNDCSSEKSIRINVFEKVVASAGDDLTICSEQSTVLTASGPANSDFLWSTGETTKSITVSPDEDTEYSVMVYHDLDSDTDSVMVKVQNCVNSQIGKDNEVIEDTASLEFLIHPNPTYGEVHIKISGLSNASSIHLYDLSGKSLYNEAISVDDNSYNKTIDLSEFASGIYLLQLVDNQKVITKKIVLR